MGIFDKMKEPVFLKESSDAEAQLEKLKALKPLLNAEGQTKSDQDIRNIEYGITGKKTVAYELKNSHMPLYILHPMKSKVQINSFLKDHSLFWHYTNKLKKIIRQSISHSWQCR